VVQGHRLAARLAAATLCGGNFLGMALLDLFPGVTPEALVGVATWLLIMLTGAEVVRIPGATPGGGAGSRGGGERRRADEERLRIARAPHRAPAGQWRIDGGTYWVALGRSAVDPVLIEEVRLGERLFGR
jgi:hypothetical protein